MLLLSLADFGLGQICRGCGDCSSCTPCPARDYTLAPSPCGTEAPVSVPDPADTLPPTSAPIVASTLSPIVTPAITSINDDEKENDGSELGCSACADLSDAEVEALAMNDRGIERVACDPTCLDGVSSPLHCNCN